MHPLRFRQVHLDFHTSEAIGGIGADFDKTAWQRALKIGHIDSITCFAKCHHGWSYHETNVGRRHPNLDFDLLYAQFEACKEIDVNVPIYISAGLDNLASAEHPEWREISPDGSYQGWTTSPISPGFHNMCFRTPYLDYLCRQIEEVLERFPAADGIFLDIITQGPCCCRWCLGGMRKEGLDPTVEADRLAFAQRTLELYYRRSTQAARSGRDDMPVFHNSGHIRRGRRDILPFFSHLELESLPTGGWGYDHFPISARYCDGLELDFLGMTGKFHTTWGEFGGYKHPNALRYECAAMLAFGAKCSVGDQLHPRGALDESTCRVIGAAYEHVEAVEPYCRGSENVADIGLLSSEAVNATAGESAADTGAGRLLLEGHYLFDVLDADADFARYRMLILPDDLAVPAELAERLRSYVAEGGKLLLSDRSVLAPDASGPWLDLGAEWLGHCEFSPVYVLPNPSLRADFVDSPMVMYLSSQRVRAKAGEALGEVYWPYFNRTWEHFSSHQHAPPRPEPSGDHAAVRHGNVLYLANPVFRIYRGYGAVAVQQYVHKAIDLLLGGRTVEADLPSAARVTLRRQEDEARYLLHLLYATPHARGGALSYEDAPVGLGRPREVEVIQELPTLRDVTVRVRLDESIRTARLVPQDKPVEFAREGDMALVRLPELTGHAMIVLE